ncbi:DUF3592 domain-containing protein [Prosthecobacter sp.]|uniref:DUF3592 domain-containing protein n=1 Tax=Prosthecobacter sp. TaxID=1965333 RepID=UPI003782D950
MMYFLIPGALLALFAFIHFLRRFSMAWSMRGWRRTQGTVVTAEMRRAQMKTADGCIMYDPVLRYSYTVDGRTFESSRFTHRTVRNPAGPMTQFIARLAQGSQVPVYYHPRHPQEAVVQPLAWRGAALAALFCAMMLAVLATAVWLT